MKSEPTEAYTPSIKYTTKDDLKVILDQKEKDYAELQQRYNQLDYAKDQLQEKLFEAGVDSRPTIMSKIIKRELDARSSIFYIIRECEKETGREFPFCSLCNERDIDVDNEL